MIGTGNGRPGDHREPAWEEMAAFDQLPFAVRRALDSAAHKWSAIDALAYVRQGCPPSEVIAAVRRQDAA